MEQHTPTPWKVSEKDWYVISNCGHICEMMGPFGYEVNKANARRIVACVNACEGIETEALETMPSGKIARLKKERDEVIIDKMALMMERDNLKVKNARLLEALKWTVENLQEASGLTDSEGGDYTEVYHQVIKAANIAIAEAEKTTQK